MPTKVKGMTSLEIAIIVAIVLIIAVAVGWYLYTTFVASTTGQPRLKRSLSRVVHQWHTKTCISQPKAPSTYRLVTLR